MTGQLLSWAVTFVGITGFILSGRKVWWSWYVNVGCQGLWFAYAIVSHQPAFFLGAIFYLLTFGNNARLWTRDRNAPKSSIEEFEAQIECVPGRHRSTECGHVPSHQPRPDAGLPFRFGIRGPAPDTPGD